MAKITSVKTSADNNKLFTAQVNDDNTREFKEYDITSGINNKSLSNTADVTSFDEGMDVITVNPTGDKFVGVDRRGRDVVNLSTTNNFSVNTFNIINKYSVSNVKPLLEYLVIGGGGAGGSLTGDNGAGGGGAGGYRTNRNGELTGSGLTAEPQYNLLLNTEYAITVGSGGLSDKTTFRFGEKGGDSSFIGDDISIISLGGGTDPYSGEFGFDNINGGSGAGRYGSSYLVNYNGGLGTPGQGNNGGRGFSNGTIEAERYGGGGGGALMPGVNGASGKSGDGGSGIGSTITGQLVYRAAGGGGGSSNASASTIGLGGNGGGGNGGRADRHGISALPNTGSGGGGAGRRNPPHNYGGDGGSGIVILRYSSLININNVSGLVFNTYTAPDDPNYTITEFLTGSGTFTFIK